MIRERKRKRERERERESKHKRASYVPWIGTGLPGTLAVSRSSAFSSFVSCVPSLICKSVRARVCVCVMYVKGEKRVNLCERFQSGFFLKKQIKKGGTLSRNSYYYYYYFYYY